MALLNVMMKWALLAEKFTKFELLLQGLKYYLVKINDMYTNISDFDTFYYDKICYNVKEIQFGL